jgi:hypothetical protein
MPPKARPSPRAAAAQFNAELDHFRSQAEGAVQFLSAYMAVNNAAVQDHAIHSALNAAPLYWATSQAALQKSFFLALGRIFDQRSDHNLDRLIGIAQENPTIFSKDALRQRKLGNMPTPLDWVEEIVAVAYEPTAEDFRKLRKEISQRRNIYEGKYRPLRDSFFARSLTIDRDEIQALFAQTNIGELEALLNFLSNVHSALSALFHEGRTLSSNAPSQMKGLSERVAKDTEATLRRLVAGGVNAPARRIRN